MESVKESITDFTLKMIQKLIEDNENVKDFWPIDFNDSDQVHELVEETSKCYDRKFDLFKRIMKILSKAQQTERKALANEVFKEQIDKLIKEVALWRSLSIHLACSWRLEQEYAKIDLEYSKK